MMYLSQLLGAPVENEQGARAGKIIDIITTMGLPPISFPVPSSPVISQSTSRPTLLLEDEADQHWYIPVEAIAWHDNVLRLRVPLAQLTAQAAAPSPQPDQPVGATPAPARPHAGRD